MKLNLQHIATNDLDRTITVAINGKRYVYTFQDAFPQIKEVFQGLLKHAPGKALSFLKNHGTYSLETTIQTH